MSEHHNTIHYTRMFLENMVGLAMNAQAAGLDLTAKQVVDSSLGKIVEMAEQQFPLAKVLDNSDLVLHAEGPGATESLPWLAALNWMTSTTETNIRKLAVAYFDMRGSDGKQMVKHMNPRLTGIAPGSLWIGIKLENAQPEGLPETDGELPLSLSSELHLLPALIRFIDDEGMLPGIEDIAPDPAMRDIGLAALLRFAPSGRKGIHTLEIGSRTEGLMRLGQRERVVLREAIEKPDMGASRSGSFIGEIREADLDKSRLHLRSVEGVGTLRCVVPEMSVESARALLGRRVCAVGNYQVNKDGKPRLLFVERFDAVAVNVK